MSKTTIPGLSPVASWSKVKVPSTSILPAITEPICFADKDRGEKPAVERLASPILYARITKVFSLAECSVKSRLVAIVKTVFYRVTANFRNFRHLKFGRTFLTIACLILVGLIGYVDYLTGYERSLLLFYFLPISLAAWFGNFAFGFTMVVVCVIVWVLSDLASGIPALGFWNIGTAFASYVLFAGVLSNLGTLVRELDRRFKEHRAALEREMVARRRLDQEIAQVADRERRRLVTICTIGLDSTSLARLSPPRY
jgi:hypothetical protein